MSEKLQGNNERLAVITGGTGGLGLTVTKTFLAAKYDVLVTYHSDEELRYLLSQVGEDKDHLDAARVDVTDEASLDDLAEKIKKKKRKVDVLLCLVGGFAAGTLGEGVGETFDKMQLLNVKSFLLTCNALVPLMKNEKRERSTRARQIIGICARPALEPTAGIGLYAASKAALASLIKTLAIELRDKLITVNAIAPSTLDTPANRKAMPRANFNAWVKPNQAAETLLFLCTPAGSAISGAIIPIYGQT